MEPRLTIGAFARRCGLSRSALRFYDECGLLRPVAVDESSGYRYYDAEQVAQALLVRRLRVAELPVDEVRRFLAAEPTQRRRILAAHSGRLRERAATVGAAVDALKRELEPAGAAGTVARCAIATATLATGLGQVVFAAAGGVDRPELAGVWIETREESLRLVATDSYRMVVRDLIPEGEFDAQPIRGVIALDRVRELRAHLSRTASVTVCQASDGQLWAELDDAVITLGGRGDAFPDYEQLLTGLPRGHRAIVARAALSDALAAVAARAPAVELRFTREAIGLAGDVSVPAAWDGPELAVMMNAGFLGEALDAMVGPDLVVEAFDAQRPVTLRCADTGTLTVLTMPIRVPR